MQSEPLLFINLLIKSIVNPLYPNGSTKDKIGLTKAYQIGASYFLKYAMYNNFDELWENHIEGLLYEYLRGTSNIEVEIERLKKAYNDTVAH